MQFFLKISSKKKSRHSYAYFLRVHYQHKGGSTSAKVLWTLFDAHKITCEKVNSFLIRLLSFDTMQRI